MASGTVDIDITADCQIAGRAGGVVNPYAETNRAVIAEIHRDIVQSHVRATSEPDAVTRVASNVHISDGDSIASITMHRYYQIAAIGVHGVTMKIQNHIGFRPDRVDITAIGTGTAGIADINRAGRHRVNCGIGGVKHPVTSVNGITVYTGCPGAAGERDFTLGKRGGTAHDCADDQRR